MSTGTKRQTLFTHRAALAVSVGETIQRHSFGRAGPTGDYTGVYRRFLTSSSIVKRCQCDSASSAGASARSLRHAPRSRGSRGPRASITGGLDRRRIRAVDGLLIGSEAIGLPVVFSGVRAIRLDDIAFFVTEGCVVQHTLAVHMSCRGADQGYSTLARDAIPVGTHRLSSVEVLKHDATGASAVVITVLDWS